ncbi:hypothetical protein [Mycobacterium simiae]|uniref:hypothetical protein n=1 Tax=Mycobacterium simiae TaxID=1784 RepID=UPI0011F24FE6|nr:hypothetical protein [Mycobacterium simiae]
MASVGTAVLLFGLMVVLPSVVAAVECAPAARLCDKANPGQVLLSNVTRVMAGRGGEHTFRSVGDLELKANR